MTIRMIIAAAIVIVLAMAVSAWCDTPATQPDGGSLEDLIRDAEKALDKQPDPSKQEPVAEPDKTGADETATNDEEEDEDPMVTALLKKAGGTGKPVMQRILEGMGDGTRLLREEFDVGQRTQKIQEQIIKDLDEAIEAAQQASSSSSSSSKGQQKGQKQQSGQKQQGQPSSGQPQTNRAQTPAGDSRASHGSVQDGEKNPDIAEKKMEWGALPDRDRDEIVQGHAEEMVPRWKAIIEKYYTALQVQSEKKE